MSPQAARLLAHPGKLALAALAAASWLLIGLAKIGHFELWPLSLPVLAVALGAALYAWRRAGSDRWILAGIALVGAVLYTPPAEHLPLFGDAAIYPNSGALIARTGGRTTTYAPLAGLSPATAGLFYVSAQQQVRWEPIESYAGLVYGAYYLTDLRDPRLETSRPPLVESWFALAQTLGGVRASLYLTPFFAILGLIGLYILGKTAWSRAAALWAVALLGVSYPQIHFARAPYAEVFGAFWALAGFYFGVLWLRQRRPIWLIGALALWVTAWATRVDALVLAGPAVLLALYAAYDRDRRGLLTFGLAGLPLALLAWLGANRPYIGATVELFTNTHRWMVAGFAGAGVVILAMLPLCWLRPRRPLVLLRRAAPTLSALVFGSLAFVVLWSTVPNPLRSTDVTRAFQEIPWFSSQYVTPLFYWLFLIGAGWLLRTKRTRPQTLLLATALLLTAFYFWRYTSAAVYPVSLRRLTSELLPLMALIGGTALTTISLPPRWQWGRWVVGAAALGWLLFLSWPLLGQHEAVGSLAYIEQLQESLPADAALVFEPQDADSFAGWLAAPLYSLYGRTALVLTSDMPDADQWREAVTELQGRGQSVYVVSQHDPLPAALTPAGYHVTLVQQSRWRSTLIGQTRQPYPPPYWEFEHPVYVYRLDGAE